MELKDLKPRESSFKLNSTGREYSLRPICLLDEIWLQENFEDLTAIFSEDSIDMKSLSRIVYHQIKDPMSFIKQEIIVIDEDGNKITEFIGGYKLLQRMIVGMEDKLAIISAFNECMGASRPEASKETEVKKKSRWSIGH